VENADLAVESEYVGRVEALQSVSLKPRITGEIAKVHFKEGSFVKAGDLLFTLDDKQYVATVDLRKADLAKAEANVQKASRYYERLKSADKRSVSASDLDIAENDVLQAKAGVAQAKATLRLAQIDLEYTKIAAPISGWIGRAELTKGNYVSPSSPALATIVQTNPVRVSFALPDKLYLEQLSFFKSSDHSVYNATLRLSDGASYPISGDRDFEDNIMDDKTGTITMRLRFPNDDGRLTPGAMVRLTVKPVQSHVSPVIPQEAILSDREGDYVYVVDAENVAQQRRIASGAEIGSMREVVSGLRASENIVVQGIQALRPNTPVRPISPTIEGQTKTPAELAMASGYDLETVPESSNSLNSK
jgi:RND family efflux transporter MFP subunit